VFAILVMCTNSVAKRTKMQRVRETARYNRFWWRRCWTQGSGGRASPWLRPDTRRRSDCNRTRPRNETRGL